MTDGEGTGSTCTRRGRHAGAAQQLRPLPATATQRQRWEWRGTGEPGKSKGHVKTRGKKDAVAVPAHNGHKAVLPQPRFASLITPACSLALGITHLGGGLCHKRDSSACRSPSTGFHRLNAPPRCCSKRQGRNQMALQEHPNTQLWEKGSFPEQRGKKTLKANRNNTLLCFKKPLLTSPEKSQHS